MRSSAAGLRNISAAATVRQVLTAYSPVTTPTAYSYTPLPPTLGQDQAVERFSGPKCAQLGPAS